MFKKKGQAESASPSLESLPEFFKSPTIPRFNSAFPPLHPGKKYRGVYERAGFEVYKGEYHTHTHDPNHPSECNSLKTRSGSNTPNPGASNAFPRNFSAPHPFQNQKSTNSEPSLNNRNSQTSKASSANSARHQKPQIRQRNFSESTASHHRPSDPNLMKPSSSTTNFNYASAYSTPGVDSDVDKDEKIRMNSFSTPVNENFDQNVKELNIQQQEQEDMYGSHEQVGELIEESPQKSFHSARGIEDSVSPPPSFAYEADSQPAGYQPQEQVEPYPTNIQPLPQQHAMQDQQNAFSFGRESVMGYEEQMNYQRVPRLSELIEEEIGATPKMQIQNEDEDDEFHDASPVLMNQPKSITPPAIVVEENYDHKHVAPNVDESDIEEEQEQGVSEQNDREVHIGVDSKRPTASTYMNRDQAYELLTGGDMPARTPALSNEHTASFSDFGWNKGEGNEDSNTDPTTATNSYGKDDIQDEIDSLTRDLNSGANLDTENDTELTDEMNRALDEKYVHRKIVSPQLNLDAATEPLSLSRKEAPEQNADISNDLDPELSPQLPTIPKYESGQGPCRKCGLEISGKSIWSKDGQISGQWHRKCFSCQKCSVPFTKGTNCYVINDSPYCEQHFHELNNSICKTCGLGVEGLCLENEKSEKFHPQCLSCYRCGTYIDKDYFMVDGFPLCEADGLIEIEREKKAYLGFEGQLSKIEKRRTRILQV